VVGQEHVTRTLSNAIRTGRLAHGFLFCGPRGVGKTTTARILAKALSCERAEDGPVADPCNECAACREITDGIHLDVLEIDGASNRGIDEIRDLRENVRYAPSGGRAKVYIIDEVHMLTKEAFNALLKTLEEPPPSVYFVFATTEVQKVPATIRSRCQRFDFHRIPSELIAKTLEGLAGKEGIELESDANAELARQADGGLRDAQSLLDQAAAVGEGKVTLETVRSLLGEAEEETTLAIVEAVANGDAGAALLRLQELLDRGIDPGRIALSLTQSLRDLLVARAAPDAAVRLGVKADLVEPYRRAASGLTEAKITALLALASRTVSDLRRSARPRLTLEVALARMGRLEDPGDLAEIAARLEALGDRLKTGAGEGEGDDRSGPPAERPAPTPPEPPCEDEGPTLGSAPRERRGRPPSGRSLPSGSPGDSGRTPPPDDAGPRAKSTPAGSAEVTRLWGELLGRVGGRKRMLGSFLEHGAPLAVDGESLSAVFDNDYYEGMVKRRENLTLIQEELATLAGRPLEFHVKVGRKPGETGPGSRRARSGETGSSELRPAAGRSPRSPDLLAENPGLKRVIHDLGGRLLPGGDPASGG
jgi:DNA polymerase-3 subunit gamma/tau